MQFLFTDITKVRVLNIYRAEELIQFCSVSV